MLQFKIIKLDTCTSTNDVAYALAKEGAKEGTVVVAKTQTAGRGRNGKTWKSPVDQGLYMSLILRPDCEPEDACHISPMMAIALHEALKSFGVATLVKWPNDIYLKNKKVAGILVEGSIVRWPIRTSYVDFVSVGVGINLHGILAPSMFLEDATTVEEATGLVLHKDAFLERLLSSASKWVAFLQASGAQAVLAEYMQLPYFVV